MTQILLRTLRDVVGGVGPANGRVKATYWAGNRAASTVDGSSVVASETFETMFVNGKAIRPINLEPTDSTKCVKWEISFGSQARLVRYTTIPNSNTPVEFNDLVIVDPDTYLPVSTTPTLVDTITNIVRTEVAENPVSPEAVAEAVEDYMIENPIDAATAADLETAIEAHREEPTPHKAYDLDIPSLTVLFENGLV